MHNFLFSLQCNCFIGKTHKKIKPYINVENHLTFKVCLFPSVFELHCFSDLFFAWDSPLPPSVITTTPE